MSLAIKPTLVATAVCLTAGWATPSTTTADDATSARVQNLTWNSDSQVQTQNVRHRRFLRSRRFYRPFIGRGFYRPYRPGYSPGPYYGYGNRFYRNRFYRRGYYGYPRGGVQIGPFGVWW